MQEKKNKNNYTADTDVSRADNSVKNLLISNPKTDIHNNNVYLGKELNKLLCFRSNPIIVFLYVLYM